MLGKVLLVIGIVFGGIVFGQNKDSIADKNKESIALLKEKIANLENGISPEKQSEALAKEIVIFRDSIVYLTKELEVCAAEKAKESNKSKTTLKEIKCNNIYFAQDIYKLSNKNEGELDSFVSQLPGSYMFIVIKGHADNTGGETLNETISRKRANAIKEYLIKEKNVTPEKIMINWFGSDIPNKDGEDRRCELVVI